MATQIIDDSLSQMSDKINELGLDASNPNLELEFRFGIHSKSKFQPEIKNRQIFTRLINYGRQQTGVLADSDTMLTISKRNNRLRIYDNVADQPAIRYYCATGKYLDGTKTELIRKENKTNLDFPDWGFRLSLASETPIEKLGIGLGLYRYIKRYSFDLGNGFRLDCSIIKESTKKANTILKSGVFDAPEKYEVELEVPLTILKNSDLQADADRHLLALLEIYIGAGYGLASLSNLNNAWQTYTRLANSINLIGPDVKPFDSETRQKFFHSSDDAEAGASQSIDRHLDNWLVTDKADGQRHLLLTTQGRFYLIGRDRDENLVGSEHIRIVPFGSDGQIKGSIRLGTPLSILPDGLLFDGEVIQSNEYKYGIMLVFDCLFDSTGDIRGRPFDKPEAVAGAGADASGDGRLSAVESFSYHDDSMAIVPKLYSPLDRNFLLSKLDSNINFQSQSQNRSLDLKLTISPSEMTSTYTISLDRDLTFNYHLDGFILQNRSDPYLVVGDRGKRAWDSALKWKPPAHLTVDFKLNYMERKQIGDHWFDLFDISPKPVQRFAKYNSPVYAVVQHGIARTIPVSISSLTGVDFSSLTLGEPVKSNNVVECAWNRDLEIWIAQRVRHDKVNPNAKYTVNRICESIDQNISFEQWIIDLKYDKVAEDERQKRQEKTIGILETIQTAELAKLGQVLEEQGQTQKIDILDLNAQSDSKGNLNLWVSLAKQHPKYNIRVIVTCPSLEKSRNWKGGVKNLVNKRQKPSNLQIDYIYLESLEERHIDSALINKYQLNTGKYQIVTLLGSQWGLESNLLSFIRSNIVNDGTLVASVLDKDSITGDTDLEQYNIEPVRDDTMARTGELQSKIINRKGRGVSKIQIENGLVMDLEWEIFAEIYAMVSGTIPN